MCFYRTCIALFLLASMSTGSLLAISHPDGCIPIKPPVVPEALEEGFGQDEKRVYADFVVARHEEPIDCEPSPEPDPEPFPSCDPDIDRIAFT